MPKLAKTSLIAGTLVITLGLTGCQFEFSLSNQDSDLIESAQESDDAAQEAIDEATEAAEEAADLATDAANEVADSASDSVLLDSDTVNDFMNQLTSAKGDAFQIFEKEAAKLYDDEKRLAQGSYQLISMHNPLTTNDNTFSDKARLAGSFTAWMFEVSKDKSIEVPYEFYVVQGKTKIILVTADKKIATLIEKSGSNSDNTSKGTFKLNLKKGKNYIRLVGKDQAIYGVNMTLPEGKFESDKE